MGERRTAAFKVIAWPKKEYGAFYNGDSYIILSTTKDTEGGKLSWDIHFWLGKDTSQDEAGTAAYKTVRQRSLFLSRPRSLAFPPSTPDRRRRHPRGANYRAARRARTARGVGAAPLPRARSRDRRRRRRS